MFHKHVLFIYYFIVAKPEGDIQFLGLTDLCVPDNFAFNCLLHCILKAKAQHNTAQSTVP